jgi:hypothetical protein
MQLLQKNKNLFLTILLVGLLVGTLDICCAFASYYLNTHKNPSRVLLSISSVAFGKNAGAASGENAVCGIDGFGNARNGRC